jgi:hypothetical protein
MSKHCYYGRVVPKRPQVDVRIARKGVDCQTTCALPRSGLPSRYNLYGKHGKETDKETDKETKKKALTMEEDDDGGGYVCDDVDLVGLNTCDVLQKHFPCERGCEGNVGSDQPAYVPSSSSGGASAGKCLFNQNPQYFSCTGRHKTTLRLCPCRKKY